MGHKLDAMRRAAAEGKGTAAGQRKPGRQPGNSPVEPTRAEKIQARDKEMDDRGRWPKGTGIVAEMTGPHEWTANVYLAGWSYKATGQALHQLLTDLYRAWVEAGKPGAS